jgi:hypothetical protein
VTTVPVIQDGPVLTVTQCVQIMAQLLMAYVNVMSDGVVFYVMLQVAQE